MKRTEVAENKRKRRRMRKIRQEIGKIEKECREEKDNNKGQNKMKETQRNEIRKDTDGEMRDNSNRQEEDEDVIYIRKHIGLVENHLRKEHEEILMTLIKSGLRAIQQWSRRITEIRIDREP